MPIGPSGLPHRLARRQEVFEHTFLNHGHRLGLHALKVERIIAYEWLALIRGLGGIVYHVNPFRQYARAGASLELTGNNVRRTIGIGNRLSRNTQIVTE